MGKIHKNRTLSYDFRLNKAKKITEDFNLLPLRTELKRQDDFGVFSTRISYTWRRLVRFPIAPDKLPERDWLGAPLSKQNPEVERFSSYFLLWEIKSLDLNTSQNWKKEKKNTHSPITRFSGEQVIIAQLQGSTESSSQLLSTPCGSFNAVFKLIRACTAEKE